MTDDKIYEILIHARGGQGAIVGAELLCEIAFADGFKDVLSVPIIGAERRGAPIRANARLSQTREIKNFSNVKDPDVTLLFDPTLFIIPGIIDGIKHGKVIINSNDNIDLSKFSKNLKIYTVDATGISIQVNLIVAGSPVLNVPMLGAYAKIMGHIKLETLKNVLQNTFGSKAELNYKAAQLAFEQVKQIQ
jgi:pyruvate ferredoxin oxidoreductase gamma subunit